MEQVEGMYVVDNTPGDGLLDLGPEVRVIRNHQNVGIATALNQGARQAIAEGYDFLLMMDQDSAPREGMVAALRAGLRRRRARAAIASPVHIDPNSAPDSGYLREQGYVRSMLTTMTAGSLLDLRAYTALVSFRDDLFIDQVDHEYCLRAHRAGFDVLQVGDAVIDHTLGERSYARLGRASIATTNHAAIRSYYMTRNRLIVAREYQRSSGVLAQGALWNAARPSQRPPVQGLSRREVVDDSSGNVGLPPPPNGPLDRRATRGGLDREAKRAGSFWSQTLGSIASGVATPRRSGIRASHPATRQRTGRDARSDYHPGHLQPPADAARMPCIAAAANARRRLRGIDLGQRFERRDERVLGRDRSRSPRGADHSQSQERGAQRCGPLGQAGAGLLSGGA